MMTIQDVIHAPLEDTVQFVREHTHHHVYLTKEQLWLMALQILDGEGLLDPQDSQILNTPLFGEAFVAEGGDAEKAMLRLGFDMLPGASLLRLI